MGTGRSILGVCLVKDEDRFCTWALAQAAGFCDRILVMDNGSTDGTAARLAALRERFGHIDVRPVADAYDTHRPLERYAGTETWVFGIDGDEVYDPAGLARLRERILGGAFNECWRLYGHSLHALRLDLDGGRGTGLAQPDARSVTKLYNFAAIESWAEGRHQRLHGKSMVFRPGFSAKSARRLWREEPWDRADFRCLHLCFFPRSSRAGDRVARPNPSETMKGRRWNRRLLAGLRRVTGGWPPAKNYKADHYGGGAPVEVALAGFGRPGEWADLDPLAAETEALIARVSAGVAPPA